VGSRRCAPYSDQMVAADGLTGCPARAQGSTQWGGGSILRNDGLSRSGPECPANYRLSPSGAGDSRFLRAMCVNPGHHNVGDQATPSYSIRGLGPADPSAGADGRPISAPVSLDRPFAWLAPQTKAPTALPHHPTCRSHSTRLLLATLLVSWFSQWGRGDRVWG
jgi:hypothetical protein